MPAEACPSFHCRPSTARTLLLPSASIRQTPTMLRNDAGSAPTVSFEKSILVVCCAATGNANVANPKTDMPIVPMTLQMLMADLHHRCVAADARGTSVASRAGSQYSKGEAHSGPYLVHGMAVRQGVTHTDIKRQVVANLPDQTNQARYGFGLSKFLFIEQFGDGPHCPLRRSLDDGANEKVCVMLS